MPAFVVQTRPHEFFFVDLFGQYLALIFLTLKMITNDLSRTRRRPGWSGAFERVIRHDEALRRGTATRHCDQTLRSDIAIRRSTGHGSRTRRMTDSDKLHQSVRIAKTSNEKQLQRYPSSNAIQMKPLGLLVFQLFFSVLSSWSLQYLNSSLSPLYTFGGKLQIVRKYLFM